MTTSAYCGSSGVVRWPSRNSDGSLCQNEAVDFPDGRLAMFWDDIPFNNSALAGVSEGRRRWSQESALSRQTGLRMLASRGGTALFGGYLLSAVVLNDISSESSSARTSII